VGAATIIADARAILRGLFLPPLVLFGESLSEVVGLHLHSDERVSNQQQNLKVFNVIDGRKVTILRCRKEASPVGLSGVLGEHSGEPLCATVVEAYQKETGAPPSLPRPP
jgi:hypothetical protein